MERRMGVLLRARPGWGEGGTSEGTEREGQRHSESKPLLTYLTMTTRVLIGANEFRAGQAPAKQPAEAGVFSNKQ
jgi:hypothetical protein